MKKMLALALFLAAAPLFAGMSSAAPVPELAPEPVPLAGCVETCHAEYLACRQSCQQIPTWQRPDCLTNCTWDKDGCVAAC